MEKTFISNSNSQPIWQVPVSRTEIHAVESPAHFGLISELPRAEREAYRASYYLVMGSKDDKWDPRPMTFDYETGRFYYSNPCGDLDEIGELYDRETAMKLISHHIINSGKDNSITIQIAPIHIPFLGSNSSADYQNPYLMSGASTEDVKDMCLQYAEREGYTDEPFYMPKSLGGEFIGYGSRPAQDDKDAKAISPSSGQQLYIITGKFQNERSDEMLPIPLCRGPHAPLTWSKSYNESGHPLPQMFDLSTAEDLVRRQTAYDKKHGAGGDSMEMHIIPLCMDSECVQREN